MGPAVVTNTRTDRATSNTQLVSAPYDDLTHLQQINQFHDNNLIIFTAVLDGIKANEHFAQLLHISDTSFWTIKCGIFRRNG